MTGTEIFPVLPQLIGLGVGGILGLIVIVLWSRAMAQRQADDKELWGNHLTTLTKEIMRMVDALEEHTRRTSDEHERILKSLAAPKRRPAGRGGKKT